MVLKVIILSISKLNEDYIRIVMVSQLFMGMLITQNFGGPGERTKPNYGVGVMFNHRFCKKYMYQAKYLIPISPHRHNKYIYIEKNQPSGLC